MFCEPIHPNLLPWGSFAACQPCAAKTGNGRTCTLPRIEGKGRCRLHGGLSTGAKTEEGKDRIRAAQYRRWQAHHLKSARAI